ncbi:GTP 3',8-cyclase [subsurface metagenome]|jgi:MoaA/NifB/PqqE/SkfB family radical SAM enzyme
MDLKIIKKDLNKENLKILKGTLGKMNPNIGKKLISWVLQHPRYLKSFFPLYRAYSNAQQTREKKLENGLQVPSTLIISITPRCNLNCEGCYSSTAGNIQRCKSSKNNNPAKTPLNREQWRKVIKEAGELGIFVNIIAGGEPFLFPELIELCGEFKDQTFVIFTNGTALTQADYNLLKSSTNLAIIVSIEGSREFTNKRRGSGVYEKALNTIKNLDQIGVPAGISATITRMNFRYWMNPENIDNLIKQNIRILFLIEYIPQTPLPQIKTAVTDHSMKSSLDMIPSDHSLLLKPEERRKFRAQILKFRSTKPIFIIHSPGDEEYFGGCVSAGRGFAHVTPAGDLTPCPVSNIATHNLTNSTLREGLASPLFKEICKNEHLLETEGMPCALFAHPEEVSALAKLVGAYKTDLDIL